MIANNVCRFQVVIERVNQSEDADRYLSPMLSEFSEMALVDVPRL